MKLRRDILVFYETVWFCTVLTGFNQVWTDKTQPWYVFVGVSKQVLYKELVIKSYVCSGIVLKYSGT